VLPEGHGTALQTPVNAWFVGFHTIEPEKPVAHVQTPLLPVLFEGQATAAHVPE
jgi:hypothetical protein